VHKFSITNQGGSTFDGEARTGASWFSVRPVNFTCAPGKSSEMEVKVDTSSLPVGEHNAQLTIYARAGKWEKIEPLQVSVNISILRTLTHFWLPPSLAALAGAGYGMVAGWLIGSLINRLGLRISGEIVAVLCGITLAVLLYAIPGAAIGLFGGIEGYKGLKAARWGALFGAAPGALVGSLAGGSLIDSGLALLPQPGHLKSSVGGFTCWRDCWRGYPGADRVLPVPPEIFLIFNPGSGASRWHRPYTTGNDAPQY
jgi:hypothetical protein